MSPLIVTAGILRDGDRLLITLRPPESRQPGFWEFPGGKLMDEESPEAALQREFKEELSLSISVGRIFDVVYYRYPWGPVLLLAYECSRISGTIRHLGVADHRWVRAEELFRFKLLPADRPLVERLQNDPPAPSGPASIR